MEDGYWQEAVGAGHAGWNLTLLEAEPLTNSCLTNDFVKERETTRCSRLTSDRTVHWGGRDVSLGRK